MRGAIGRFLRVLPAVLLINGVWIATAFAQRPTAVNEAPSIVRPWLTVLLSAGLIVAVAFKNPKRTHLG